MTEKESEKKGDMPRSRRVGHQLFTVLALSGLVVVAVLAVTPAGPWIWHSKAAASSGSAASAYTCDLSDYGYKGPPVTLTASANAVLTATAVAQSGFSPLFGYSGPPSFSTSTITLPPSVASRLTNLSKISLQASVSVFGAPAASPDAKIYGSLPNAYLPTGPLTQLQVDDAIDTAFFSSPGTAWLEFPAKTLLFTPYRNGVALPAISCQAVPGAVPATEVTVTTAPPVAPTATATGTATGLATATPTGTATSTALAAAPPAAAPPAAAPPAAAPSISAAAATAPAVPPASTTAGAAVSTATSAAVSTATGAAASTAIPAQPAPAPDYECTSTYRTPTYRTPLPMTITTSGALAVGGTLTVILSSPATGLAAPAPGLATRLTFAGRLAVTGAQTGALTLNGTSANADSPTFAAEGRLPLTATGTDRISFPRRFAYRVDLHGGRKAVFACTLTASPAPAALTIAVAP